jgi:hypothetical protein
MISPTSQVVQDLSSNEASIEMSEEAATYEYFFWDDTYKPVVTNDAFLQMFAE